MDKLSGPREYIFMFDVAHISYLFSFKVSEDFCDKAVVQNFFQV